jgi:hypothetical protein
VGHKNFIEAAKGLAADPAGFENAMLNKQEYQGQHCHQAAWVQKNTIQLDSISNPSDIYAWVGASGRSGTTVSTSRDEIRNALTDPSGYKIDSAISTRWWDAFATSSTDTLKGLPVCTGDRGCAESCAEFHQDVTNCDGMTFRRCADADSARCTAVHGITAPTFGSFNNNLEDAWGWYGEAVGTYGNTGTERVASKSWRDATVAICNSDSTVLKECPNACKLAGAIVHDCTTPLSSAWNCQYLRTFSYKDSDYELKADSSYQFTEAKNYYFVNEGTTKSAESSIPRSPPPSLVDEPKFENRHCAFLEPDGNDQNKHDKSYQVAHSFCRDLRARLCFASEVEAFSSGSSSKLRFPDTHLYWTQSSERVAPLETGDCEKGESMVVGYEEVSGTREFVSKCRSRDIGVARLGLCCGDDNTFIVT